MEGRNLRRGHAEFFLLLLPVVMIFCLIVLAVNKATLGYEPKFTFVNWALTVAETMMLMWLTPKVVRLIWRLESTAGLVKLAVYQYPKRCKLWGMPKWLVDRALLLIAGMTLTYLTVGIHISADRFLQLGFWPIMGLGLLTFAWIVLITLALVAMKLHRLRAVRAEHGGHTWLAVCADMWFLSERQRMEQQIEAWKAAQQEKLP